MDKIIVSLAPIGNIKGEIDINRLVDEVIACKRLGASMVHLHVVDRFGKPTSNLEIFDNIVRGIRKVEDIIIEGSTGGLSDLDAKERSVCLSHPLVEASSLNMGSVNMGDDVYINKMPDIRWWAELIGKRKLSYQLEIFDLSMIYTAEKLIREELISESAIFNICLGFDSVLPATQEVLLTMVNSIPKKRRWGFIHHNFSDFRLIATAISLGATIIRVGREDCKDTKKSNIELVDKVVRLIREMDKEIATVEEARLMLGLEV
ncbi:MAG: 3-keto-5-aminohexanoate cleavage protein [bacterium]|nr:3-keto-5-aminohexanoate cleavage protein [bacterium]